jgi:hypothetical protein
MVKGYNPVSTDCDTSSFAAFVVVVVVVVTVFSMMVYKTVGKESKEGVLHLQSKYKLQASSCLRLHLLAK